jgi:hypothetical protein
VSPAPEIRLPWERQLWTGRSLRIRAPLAGERYLLTDFRLVRVRLAPSGRPPEIDEIALQDIGEVVRTRSRIDRLLGTSTLIVHSRRNRAPLALSGVRRGAQLAAVIELLGSDPRALSTPEAVAAALSWDPRSRQAHFPSVWLEPLAAFGAVVIAILAVGFGPRRAAVTVSYTADDAIAPHGVKRGQTEIVRFMEAQVMPWAQTVIGRVKGGADRVTCETCHGPNPAARSWQMPAVAALPQPDVRERGWEVYSGGMDAQMRNAIYGYTADSGKLATAAYMREVVVPGMAALLHRPAYDFTRSYEFNRSRNALGCYHCHRVR